MYRVLFVLSGGLLLAACSSTPDWMSLDALKPAPITESVQFETEPAGATATLSTGQNCKTPCAVTVPADKPFSVTFTLTGYQPASEEVESVLVDGSTKLRPNPVSAELTPAPPPPKPAKKPARKKTSAAKPAAAPKPKAAAAPPPPAASAPAPAPAASSPWPSAAPAQQ
ncbi:MAG TPA: PEGA domain-containing protein [Pseudolabrys sp.]|jgi:hypothetical protein|nr:PEGA domain-containing protein [Pseudolabrys sp.]